MADGPLVTVDGWRELNRLFAKADAESRKQVRQLEAELARPIAIDIEGLAGSRIRKITPEWKAMRAGVTQKLVYVVPKKRGTKVVNRKRPKFSTLMNERAFEPARQRNQPLMNARMARLFAEIADRWNRTT